MGNSTVRIGDEIWLVVPCLHFPYWSLAHQCGVVKMGFEGEYIVWFA